MDGTTMILTPETNDDLLALAKEIEANPEKYHIFRDAFIQGTDCLGDAYMGINSPQNRRSTGQTYTPMHLVDDMVRIGFSLINPNTIVDCGCGSGRFAVKCALANRTANIIAIDESPVACSLARANAALLGISDRIQVIHQSFLSYSPPQDRGRTLWIGNPPYVRHHDIPSDLKDWLKTSAKRFGFNASALSGLHIYFLAKIAELWQADDAGVLITSAEWLDANYGLYAKQLLKQLGLKQLIQFDKHRRVFPDVETTAVISAFHGKCDFVTMSFSDGTERTVQAEELYQMDKWSCLSRNARQCLDNLVPLGSYARVHRGIATGNNKFWVRDTSELSRFPDSLSIPIVSHAKELIGQHATKRPEMLKRLIALPEDLSNLEKSEADAARIIISEGEGELIDCGYLARHRKKWWSIHLPPPAAILMTYMGRNTPTFIVNSNHLLTLNVIHGIYPTVELSQKAIDRLCNYLNSSTDINSGRVYSGGLVKFEPSDVESLMVPSISVLEA